MFTAVPDVRTVGPVGGRIAMAGGAGHPGGIPVGGRCRGVAVDADRIEDRLPGPVGEIVAERQSLRHAVAGDVGAGLVHRVEYRGRHARADGRAVRVVEPDKPQAVGPVHPVTVLAAIGSVLVVRPPVEGRHRKGRHLG